jgi:hypothetical protein
LKYRLMSLSERMGDPLFFQEIDVLDSLSEYLYF